jgi:hypothetical protein
VNAYHVECGASDPQAAGSPGSRVAAVKSCWSENGTALNAIALAKSSFGGGGTTAILSVKLWVKSQTAYRSPPCTKYVVPPVSDRARDIGVLQWSPEILVRPANPGPSAR